MIKNILYVEDEHDTRVLFSQILQDYCKNLYVAEDGLEGLEIYKNNQIDVVFTDITMPKMDGLAMAKEILAEDKDAYIIVLSAYNENKYLHDAIDMGIHNYLLKPIELEKLEAILEKINKELKETKIQECHTQELKEINDVLHERLKKEIAKNKEE